MKKFLKRVINVMKRRYNNIYAVMTDLLSLMVIVNIFKNDYFKVTQFGILALISSNISDIIILNREINKIKKYK